jgi:quinol monooxygenase YgiN
VAFSVPSAVYSTGYTSTRDLDVIYDDETAVDAHRAAPHFRVWRAAAAKYVVPGSQVNTLSRRLFHHS